jgi:hypothetical protein
MLSGSPQGGAVAKTGWRLGWQQDAASCVVDNIPIRLAVRDLKITSPSSLHPRWRRSAGPDVLGRILGPTSLTRKLSPYECGFEAFEDARMKFDVRYYLVAILFILFDLEIAFFFPGACPCGTGLAVSSR